MRPAAAADARQLRRASMPIMRSGQISMST